MPYLVFIASLISPIYTFGLTVLELLKKHTNILPVISFCLAFAMLAGSINPPFGWDLDTHYKQIDALRGLSLSYIIHNSYSGYLGFNVYAWLIIKLGLPKEFFTASIVFFAYLIVVSIFNNLKKSHLMDEKTNYIAIYFLCLWLSIDFIFLTSGIRNSFANILVFLATYLLITYKKHLLFCIFSLLAFAMHPAAIIPILCTLVSVNFSSISRYSRAIAIISVGFIIISNPVNLILGYAEGILSNLSFYKPIYFEDGKWGSGFTQDRSLIGLIGIYLIARLPTYIALCYVLLKKPVSKNSPLLSLICVLLLYLSLFFSYYTLFDRINAFFLLIFSVYLIKENAILHNQLNRFTIQTYFLALIIYSIYHIYIYKPFIISAIPTIFKPLLFVAFGL